MDEFWDCPRCGANNAWRHECRKCSLPQEEAVAMIRESVEAAGPASASTDPERTHRSPVAAIAGVAMVIALAAGAFVMVRSRDDGASSSAKDPRSADQIAVDLWNAHGMLMQLADLPEGWTSEPRPEEPAKSAEERDADNRSKHEFATCSGLDPAVLDDDTPSPAKAKSDKFKGPDREAAEVSVTIEPSTATVADDLRAIRDKDLSLCWRGLFVAELQYSLAHPDPGQALGMTFDNVNVERLTLDIAAPHVVYRVTATLSLNGRSVDVVNDTVMVGKGRAEFTFTYTGGAPNGAFPADVEAWVTNSVLARASDT